MFSNKKTKSVRALYCAPDTTYKKGYNHYFFEQQFVEARKNKVVMTFSIKSIMRRGVKNNDKVILDQ